MPSPTMPHPAMPHPSGALPDPAILLRVLETARSYLACRAEVAEIVSGRAPAPANLGEAIDRDFRFFDLERAAQALGEAVAAATPDPVPAPLPARDRHARR